MRNTTDDPTWTSLIYHDHISWFRGTAHPVENSFARITLNVTLLPRPARFRDTPNRKEFFDEIATMKPEDLRQGSVDAIATQSADGRRIVIKAFSSKGSGTSYIFASREGTFPRNLRMLHTINAGRDDAASLERPVTIAPVSRRIDYAREFTAELQACRFAVVEFQAFNGTVSAFIS